MKPYIFIDESGTLPDPKDKVIVVAAIGTESLSGLGKVLKSVKKGRTKPEKSLELKFYKAGLKTKTNFFKELAKQQVSIFILIVDKMGRKIPDSPENFAVLCGLLICEVLNFYNSVQKVVFDRHFHRSVDEIHFNKAVSSFLKSTNIPLEHQNSKENLTVNVADMIAGAVLAKETGKDTSFYNRWQNTVDF
ncbi:MAG: DUF3800 domain-containing protein [bacterium]|nr:DUF3800 domain-containing protein [bacterium]